MIQHLASLRAHGEWADALLLAAVRDLSGDTSAVLRELAHVRAAQEIWLSRLEHRTTSTTIWPVWSIDELAQHAATIDAALAAYFASLTPERLSDNLEYKSLAGQPFHTPIGDVLLHLLMHGHYHRGKANVALRDAGAAAVGLDYIIWQRAQDNSTRAML